RRGDDPVARHLDVEQARVRRLAPARLDRLLGAACPGADEEAVALEREPDAGPSRNVVVCHEHPNPRRHNTTTSTDVPRFGADSIVSLPPTARARSRMLT